MELIKELHRNDTKSHGQIPTITPFNEDSFYRAMENIVDNHGQLFKLGKHIERLNRLEDMGLSSIEETAVNMDNTEENADDNSLSIKGELQLIADAKMNDIRHDIRCLSAYQLQRMKNLRSIKWATGTNQLPTPVLNNLNKNEQTWYRKNVNSILDFMKSSDYGISHLDLTTDLEPPSCNNVVQVQCNSDLGQVMLSNGSSVTFEKGMIYSFPRSEVEKYVRLGDMDVIL